MSSRNSAKFQHQGWERHLRLRQCGCGLEHEPLHESLGQQSPYEWIQAPLEITGRLGQELFFKFNPRSLVESFQTSSGHNWSVEKFDSILHKGAVVVGNATPGRVFTEVQMPDGTTYPGRERPPYRWRLNNPTSEPFADFDDFNTTKHFTQTTTTGRSFVSGAAFPLVDDSGEYCIGYFHEDQNLDMESQAAFDSAILFGVPRSPLLSLVQFRHANFKIIFARPAYVVGNSYATTQVARYKT